jgi:Nucleotidyl transferase AbiEii toxin, Type IV TA system
MSQCLEPKLDVLPAAQKEIWTSLAPAPHLDFALYGGTAIALHLGHRASVDFDFFRSEPLEGHRGKEEVAAIQAAISTTA